jgi:hypothetical protein
MRGMPGIDQQASAAYVRVLIASGQPQQARGRSAMTQSASALQYFGSGTQSVQQPPSASPRT